MSQQPSHLEYLWELAERTLAQEHPSPQQLQALTQALKQVPLGELGLLPSGPPPGTPTAGPSITYLHIYEDSNLSLGIFCLPAKAEIPLHNHPGMTVLSRVLYGQMHVTSFDWRDPPAAAQPSSRGHSGASRPAVPVYDRVFGPEDPPAVLFPSHGGNIHAFSAVTDCAVLDLLSPPYSTDDGRDCTYYRMTRREDGVVELEEYEPPTEFVIHSGEYAGRSIDRPQRPEPHPHPRPVAAAAAVAAPYDGSASSPGSGSPRSVTPPLSPPSSAEAEATTLANLLKESSLGSVGTG